MNLYVHFPFCRRKCAYCALFSVAGRDEDFRARYVEKLVRSVVAAPYQFKTVYFGGGTPALCDLRPLFDVLQDKLRDGYEWTVEVNPLDVTLDRMKEFCSAGVNRISMGVQSLDDDTLREMGRGHTAADALIAFKIIRDAGFANAGIDLIAGYPSKSKDAWKRTFEGLVEFSPDHCSVYSLIREEGTLLDRLVKNKRLVLPDDNSALNELAAAREALAALSLERYEISSYAKKGFECKHNFAVWLGEDYLGLGAGAHGRMGRRRTAGTFDNLDPFASVIGETDCIAPELTEEEDALERTLFRLRTRKGFNLDSIEKEYPILASRIEKWRERLLSFVREGLVIKSEGSDVFILTDRGMEVCDAVLSELL